MLLSCVKYNVWMFVKPNTNPNTRLSKWVLETISTVYCIIVVCEVQEIDVCQARARGYGQANRGERIWSGE